MGYGTAESGCSLRATDNIFGRLINGVQEGDECSKAAKPKDSAGNFLHAEQSEVARENFDIWISAFVEAFN